MSSKKLKLKLSTASNEAAKVQAASPRGSGANRRDSIVENGKFFHFLHRIQSSSILKISRQPGWQQ
jgi:hypothetical protein